jgi:hypothetical protein
LATPSSTASAVTSTEPVARATRTISRWRSSAVLAFMTVTRFLAVLPVRAR